MKILRLWIIALVALLAGGCATETPLHHPVTPDHGTVKIGVVLPLSGCNAKLGLRILDGIRYACEVRNTKRGLCGHPIELVEADSGSSPEGSLTAARQLVAKGVCGIVAGYTTEEVLPLREDGALPLIPVINTMATGDMLAGSPLFLSATFLEYQQGRVIAGYLWFFRKAIRLAVLQESRNGDFNHYSKRLARTAAQQFINLGGEVVANLEYDPESGNFTRILQSALAGYPNAIFIPAEKAETAGILIRQLRNLGFGGLIIGPDSWDDPALLEHCGKQPGDALFLGFYAEEPTSSAHAAFRNGFRERRFFYPSCYEAQGFDSFNLLCDAIADATTLEQFEENLTSIRNRPGAGGLYSLLPNGKIERSILLKALRPAASRNGMPSMRLVQPLTESQFREYEEINTFTRRRDDDENGGPAASIFPTK